MNIDAELLAGVRSKLKKELNKHRYEHTLGVAYTSACLAMVHGEDILRAELAGLLHDCAKGYKGDELIRLCKKHKVPLREEEIASPQVIHGKYGVYLAKEDYDVKDPDILNAISYHTTGRPEMSTLEKIVFIADYIEPLRYQQPGLSEVRKLAFEDLDACMYRILKDTVEYLNSTGTPIVSDTLSAYHWFQEEREN